MSSLLEIARHRRTIRPYQLGWIERNARDLSARSKVLTDCVHSIDPDATVFVHGAMRREAVEVAERATDRLPAEVRKAAKTLARASFDGWENF